MTDLPTGWTETTLRAICSKIVDGSHNPPRAVAAGRPMLSARNVRDRAIHLDEFRFISDDDFEQEHARTQVQAGDVLLTIVGAIGRTAVVPSGAPVFALQRSVAVLRPLAMEPRALAYALEAPDVQKYMTDNARGTAQKGIYLGTLATVEVKLPPAAEQQRIADKLDTVLARVDACRDRLARVAPLLKRFRQSVLAAATLGRLTEDWRRGEHFRTTLERFSELVAESLVGLVRAADEQSVLAEGLVPYLKMNNISEEWGHSSGGLVGVRCSADEIARYALMPGDWLFNTRNSVELVGKSCVWKGDPVVFNNNILRARFNQKATPDFVEVWFRSPSGRAALASIKSATTSVAAIYQKSLFAVRLDLPPVEEQTEIVRRVETLFAFADRLKARLAQAQTAVGRLTPSLLSKAFRGELVPQDPNDEPASTLLARITAERSAPAPTSRPRSPSAGRPPRAPKETAAMTKSRQDDDVMGQPYLAGRLRRIGTPTSAEALFKLAELPVADFYKQLAWEVAQGHVKDNQTTLEPGYAAG